MQVAAALLDVQWPTERWPVYVFLAGAMACLLTSATCHLLSCCSYEAGQTGCKLELSCCVCADTFMHLNLMQSSA
jgi:predicted membrane channel-forming protein YqfA (hemolysin III family)